MSDTKFKVLIVEDDKNLSSINRRALESEGYEVHAAHTAAEARGLLKDAAFDVILLDVKLPDGTGFELCREIRPETAAHIIFLTSVRESEGEMEGLDAGGNDYLRKPYKIELLRKRVSNAVKNRPAAIEQKTVKRGSLMLDIMANQAFIDGNDLLLSQKEFAVLLFLIKNEGQTKSAEIIYENAWGQPMGNDKNAVQVAVSRLRKKIEPAGYSIRSAYGKGYVFESLQF